MFRRRAKEDNDGDGVSTANTVDLEEFNEVLRMVHDTDIIELSLKTDSFQINVRKREALEAENQAQSQAMMMQQPVQAQPALAAVAPVAQAQPAPSAAPAPAPAAPAPASKPKESAGTTISSPMAGTFYRSPGPGEPPFVKEGDTVSKGSKVCIIEAMKLMNDIEAETSGKIVEFLVEDGQPVTPGQGLMVIA